MRKREAGTRGSGRLERRRRLSRLVLTFERLWPALWPPLGVLGAFVALALFGAIAVLPPWPHVALLVLFAAALAFAAVVGFSGFSLPSRREADRRLEVVNGLRHRPLAALTDQPAINGTAAGLWKMHVERAAAKLARARVGLPHPGLAARDRRALRVGVILALAVGVVVAGGDAIPRVADAFTPKIPSGPPSPAAELALWITPPAYTHLPPVFLAPPGGALAVPTDSRLAVSVTGGQGTPRLTLANHRLAFEKLSRESYRASDLVEEGGRLVLRRGAKVLGAWELTLIAPGAPIVAFGARPGVAPGSDATRIPWQVRDRYGVTDLTALMTLAARPGATPIRVPIPLADVDPRHASGAAIVDLSANPWAGLEVRGVLLGRNGAGLRGRSAPREFRLPEVLFHNPIARALIAVRKDLALDPSDRSRAITALGRLSAEGAVHDGDLGGFLNMRAIAALLADDHTEAAIADAQDRLWELAWHYEAGPMARTRRELAAAERALAHALARADQKGGAKTAELDRRISQLERAIQHQIAALAKHLAAKGLTLPNVPAAERYDQHALDRLTEAMRRAVDRGDLRTAKNEMAELQRLLRRLKNAQPLSARDLARARQLQKGTQAMGALGDVVEREGGLVNHAETRLSQGSHAGQGARSQSATGRQGARGAPSADEDQAVQRALRRALGIMMDGFADATGKIPPALGEADIAMRGAAAALGKGANGGAAALERKAIADLQRGGEQAMAAMAAAQRGEGAGGSAGGFLLGMAPFPGSPAPGQGAQMGSGDLDPLGRPIEERADGGRANGYVAIPDHDVAAIARAIQEELRHRDANPALPAPDRNYINRLLKQF